MCKPELKHIYKSECNSTGIDLGPGPTIENRSERLTTKTRSSMWLSLAIAFLSAFSIQ